MAFFRFQVSSKVVGKSALLVAVLVGVLLAVPGRASAADESAEKIIGRVQKTVKNLKTLSCSFEQEFFMKTTDRTTTISGTIRVKSPTMLRVEYPAQTIVVDGKSVWWYIPKNKQVTLQKYEEGEEMFPTPYGIFRNYVAGGDSAGNAVFEGAANLNGRACYILRLGERGDSNITVWIDRELNFPVKSVEERANGDRTIYVLRDVRLNGKLDSGIFTFEAPEGVTTVDMR